MSACSSSTTVRARGFSTRSRRPSAGAKKCSISRTHIHPLHIEGRTRFLICSDGLTDMLHSPEIREILGAEKSAERAVIALFNRAMNAGGVDNITLAVIEIERI